MKSFKAFATVSVIFVGLSVGSASAAEKVAGTEKPPVPVEHLVEMHLPEHTTMRFSPEALANVEIGDVVVFDPKKLPGLSNHDVDFFYVPDGVKPFASPKGKDFVKPFSVTFTVPGIYLFRCTGHVEMVGIVLVGNDMSNREAAATATSQLKSKDAKVRMLHLLNQLRVKKVGGDKK